jgi:hypothetical protein
MKSSQYANFTWALSGGHLKLFKFRPIQDIEFLYLELSAVFLACSSRRVTNKLKLSEAGSEKVRVLFAAEAESRGRVNVLREQVLRCKTSTGPHQPHAMRTGSARCLFRFECECDANEKGTCTRSHIVYYAVRDEQ